MSLPPISDPPEIPGPHWLFITDSHCGQSMNLDNVRTAVDLARAAAQGPIEGTIHGGDGNENPTDSFQAWWRDPEGGGAPESEKLIQAAGNWDTETAPGEGAAADPFATWRSRQWWCTEREWGRVSVDGVSIYLLNDLSDLLYGGASCYDNCNPPGDYNTCNPDWSGILDPNSAQRQWLAAELAQDEHPFKVAVLHRPPWAPFSGPQRPVHTAARAVLLGCGFSLVLGGDIHIGSLTGPLETNGLYCLTLAGGYVVRAVDLNAYPGEPVLWSQGGAHASGLAHCALLSFVEDTIYLRIYAASNANPTGGQVFAAVLPRNG